MADTGERTAEHGSVKWAWVGRALLGLVGMLVVSVGIEAARQGRANGEALASMTSELKVRVATAEEQYRTLVRRDELTEIVKRLDETLKALREDLREQRRDQRRVRTP